MLQISKKQSVSDFLFDPANTSTKHISPYIVVYFVKVIAIATTFQEFIFIVKYCPFTFTFGARSLSSIRYKQKKILLVFRTYAYPNRCAKMKFHTQNDMNNVPKMM